MSAYKSYVDTPLPWLSQMPSHWTLLRNKNFLQEVKETVGDTSADYTLLSLTTKGIIPRDVASGKGKFPKDFDTYKVVTSGDIAFCLFDIDETPRTVGLSEHDGMLTGAYTVFRLSGINPQFFTYYYLALDNVKALRPLYSGLRKTIKTNVFLGTKFPAPPREEQDQIVRYLDWQVSKTNKLISALKKQIALLHEQKKAVINSAVTKGLDLAVPMKDSCIPWIGEIPAHWSIIKLRCILKPVSVKNHPELPLLSVVRELGVIIRDVEDVESNHNFIPDDLSNYKVVREGQFAMNKMKAWQGSYGISPYTGIVSPAYFVFDVDFPNSDYFHYAIRSKVYVNFFAKSSDGIRVGQWDLNMQKMKEIPFIVPPASEQDEIVAHIPKANAKIEKAIEDISQEIALLKEYRIRLISDVVTGQVDVRDVEVPEFEYIADESDLASDDESIDTEETVEEEA